MTEPFGIRIGPDGTIVTGQPHDGGAAGRVRAYLDACGGIADPTPNLPCHRAVHFDVDETTIYELTRADLREVLRQLDDARAEAARLHAQVAELEDAVPARIAAEMERDELKTKLESALTTITALTQTIRAYPDAVAQDAANIAHARAQRDAHYAEVARLRAQLEAVRDAGAEWNTLVAAGDEKQLPAAHALHLLLRAIGSESAA
jgi:hypothetical protein